METTLFKKKKLVGESNLIKKQKGKQKRWKLPGPETLRLARLSRHGKLEKSVTGGKIERNVRHLSGPGGKPRLAFGESTAAGVDSPGS